MAIEDIFRALDEQADAEVQDILDSANAQAGSIIDEAKAEADKIRAGKLDTARSATELRASRLLNAASLDNKRALAAVKERGIAQVYDAASRRLSELRKESSYAGLFRSLAQEALAGLDGDVVVMVDPADEALAKQTMADLDARATIDASQHTAGGLTILADGGRVYRRNTLEDRLSKARMISQSRVAEILFG